MLPGWFRQVVTILYWQMRINLLLVASASGEAINLPFTQKTLDSLQIKITLDKFKTGAIRKPVSIPGTYQSLPKNGQGFIKIYTGSVKRHL